MIMLYGPEEPLSVVAFSINHILLTVFGPIVMVQSESKAPVYFKYKDRPGSVAPSAIVVACVFAFVVSMFNMCVIS